MKFESGTKSNKHVFDIKTTKRIYYLASKSEAEMNKWVDCICKVCGLKIHDDEDAADYRYSPQPSQEFMVTPSTVGSSVTPVAAAVLADVVPTTSSSYMQPTMSLPPIPSTDTTPSCQAIRPVTSSRPSPAKATSSNIDFGSSEAASAYLLISECHTGRPVDTKPPGRSPLSESNQRTNSTAANSNLMADEFYDIPRPLKSTRSLSMSRNVGNKRSGGDILNRVPAPPGSTKGLPTPAPSVNWSTYPEISDTTRSSVRSCNASFDAKGGKFSRTRCESGPTTTADRTRRSTTPLNTDYLNTSEMSIVTEDVATATPPGQHPPPRPPKPASLRLKNRSGSCSSLPELFENRADEVYDIPPPTSMTLKRDKLAVERLPCSTAGGHQEPPKKTTSVRLVDRTSPPTADALYDFPKPSSERETMPSVCDLNATVPLPSAATLGRNVSKQHSYTNAPTGFFGNKESVFTYDYRPSLPTSSSSEVSSQIIGSSVMSDSTTPEQSPRTPNSAGYSVHGKKATPPAVNRDLKPRRKNSDSDATVSPTTPVAFNLLPPPAVVRGQAAALQATGSSGIGNQKSFSKKSNQQLLSPPRVPTRPSLVKPAHSRDASFESTYDEIGTGQAVKVVAGRKPVASKVVLPEATDEIQYLDLDLESDTNSSPRTPNFVALVGSSVDVRPSPSPKDGSVLGQNPVSGSPSLATAVSSSSCSTVYKTVDFVRTSAFNKLRLNLEDHRSNQ